VLTKNQSDVIQLPRVKPLEPPTKISLRFWGTRGSIPVSGASYLRYGGNTSCVTLTSDTGHLYIFDCGSGARILGNYLLSPEWSQFSQKHTHSENISAYIFLSHTHWDHIQGFPFFAPAFRPGNQFRVIGWSECPQDLIDVLGGQMQQCYFPVGLNALPADITMYTVDNDLTELDGALISTALLKHPIPSSAYRLELAGKVLVYATDYEPQTLPHIQPDVLLGDDVVDPKLVKLAANADALIHDAQYSTAELAEKVGWGHNSAEVAVDTSIRAGVKKLVLYHHDPAHDDAAIDKILADAQARAISLGHPELEIIAASDGLTLEL
jgi:phosphoribosyl 1,2-cyclic phosphodiesterase